MCQEAADSDYDNDCDIDDVDDSFSDSGFDEISDLVCDIFFKCKITYDLLLHPQINELHLCNCDILKQSNYM